MQGEEQSMSTNRLKRMPHYSIGCLAVDADGRCQSALAAAGKLAKKKYGPDAEVLNIQVPFPITENRPASYRVCIGRCDSQYTTRLATCEVIVITVHAEYSLIKRRQARPWRMPM